MKTIVTHLGPDLDAITSVWLIKTCLPGWEEADVVFVPAGSTYKKLPPDDNPDILHVDTGFGKFDHHQTEDESVCASVLIYRHASIIRGEDIPLSRLVAHVNEIDHFKEVFYPNPTADLWDFSLSSMIDGWRLIHADNPMKIVALGMDALDGVYKTFQNKVWAEKELKEKGIEFESPWGKSLGIETTNDEVVHLGQKMGYIVVIRKDPKKGYLRIKASPKEMVDLTPFFERFKTEEPDATWFLHVSRRMILNGSAKNPDMKPTNKSLREIIEVLSK